MLILLLSSSSVSAEASSLVGDPLVRMGRQVAEALEALEVILEVHSTSEGEK